MKTKSDHLEESETECHDIDHDIDHDSSSNSSILPWNKKTYQKVQTANSEEDLVPINKVSSTTPSKNLQILSKNELSPRLPIVILKANATPPITSDRKTTSSSSPSYSPIDNNTLHSHNDTEQQMKATYCNLLRYNRPFRLFILCYILTLTGEWFTYVASISLIERKNGPNSPNIRAETGLLVLAWLMPNMLFSVVGGVVADSQDRRKTLIYIDLASALITSGYFLAYYYNSLVCLYIVTFFRQSGAGLYEPCSDAMIQMMVCEEELLKKATTLIGFVWATIATFGSALGGLTVASLGIQACFLMDMSTYFASAYIMYRIGGAWKAQQQEDSYVEEQDEVEDGLFNDSDSSQHPSRKTSPWKKFLNMAMYGVLYLRSNFFGPLIFLKFSAAIIYGSLTLIQISVSEIYGIETQKSHVDETTATGIDLSASSALLGILLACTGVGSFIGTFITDRFANVKNAQSLQLGCIWCFLLMSIAYLCMGTFLSFPIVCICSAFIYVALTIVWIQSDLIFQLFSSSTMMGRVSAVDYALATSAEGLSSFFSGVLEDSFKLSVRRTCFMMSMISIIIFAFWCTFHSVGGGAARVDFDDTKTESSSNSQEELEITSNLGHFTKD